MYGGLNHGRLDVDRLRTVPAGLWLPRFDGGRLVWAADVPPWLRPDAPCSAERHVLPPLRAREDSLGGSFRAGHRSSWPCWKRVPRPGPRSWTRSGSDRRTTQLRSPPPSSGVSSSGSSPLVNGRPGTRIS
ncbi:hypothetical protein [Streptomyces sp. Inha503]|uniref:hypothetical protein n=1 Tax=Streptomyces sp. Inha503 TaxID=3383314 RepID=UPI0039A3CEC1